MTIIGFNFTKVQVERKEGAAKQVNVQNNIGISGVEEAQVNIGGGTSKALKFNFFFHSTFEPELGHIKLDGEVIALFDASEAQTIMDGWKKDKKVPTEQATRVLNISLSKAQIMALLLSKEVNLPAPVQLPKIEAQQQKK